MVIMRCFSVGDISSKSIWHGHSSGSLGNEIQQFSLHTLIHPRVMTYVKSNTGLLIFGVTVIQSEAHSSDAGHLVFSCALVKQHDLKMWSIQRKYLWTQLDFDVYEKKNLPKKCTASRELLLKNAEEVRVVFTTYLLPKRRWRIWMMNPNSLAHKKPALLTVEIIHNCLLK